MAKKRFTVDEFGRICDYEKGINQEVVCINLNVFHEIQEELKEENKELKQENEELKKENEQSKRQIGNLEHTRDYCAECSERLEKEIKQLRQKNEILIQTIERLCEAW